MSVPEELVTAAAEALMRPDNRKHSDAEAYFEGRARAALVAAFAKLAECEEAVRLIAGEFNQRLPGANDSIYAVEDARLALAALAKWGQP